MSIKSSLLGTVGAAGIALLTLSGAASAEDREFSWSVTATGTTDYIFRGISFSNEDPVLQGSFDVTYGIWYAGVWSSGIDNGDAYDPVEIDIYTGIKPVVGPFTFDFGVLGYTYPFADGPSAEYVELKAGVSVSPITNLTLKPTFYYTPDQGSNYPETWTIEGGAAYQLPALGIFTPTISGLVGYTKQTDSVLDGADFTGFGIEDYTYWNAGLALAVEKFTFDFRYWDTDIDSGLADDRFVFTASITLP